VAEWRTPEVIGTVLNPVTIVGTVGVGVINDVATIGTILGGAVTATVSGGQLADVGTVGTISAIANIAVASAVGSIQSLANMAVASAIGTVLSIVPTLEMGQFVITTIQNNAQVVASGSQIVTAATLQDLVVDSTYGTLYPQTGSVQVFVGAMDALSGILAGSIVGGPWVSGTVQSAHRVVAAGPLGYKVGVFWVVVNATLNGFYLSAQQSFGA
jgi:hypothetical protein